RRLGRLLEKPRPNRRPRSKPEQPPKLTKSRRLIAPLWFAPRRPVSLVVVGHRAGAALLQRKSRLGAVERLDLALLVDRKHQRLVRRVEVKPDNVLNLLTKLRIIGELEAARQVRLEVMRRPDALHARMAETDRLSHLAQRPVRAPPAAFR